MSKATTIRISERLAINFDKLSGDEISRLIDACTEELARRMEESHA